MKSGDNNNAKFNIMIDNEIQELCEIKMKKNISDFFLDYIDKHYNNSLRKFTELYSEMFELNHNDIKNSKLKNSGKTPGARIITRCFISRVFWKKLLTGTGPHDKDQIYIRCKYAKNKDKRSTCLVYNYGKQNNDIYDLYGYLSDINYNNKVASYTIHPDHEFNIFCDDHSMFHIQSWIFEYPLRIYHFIGRHIYHRYITFVNKMILDIYKNNLVVSDSQKLFYKLFMNYSERIYDQNIVYREINDNYAFVVKSNNVKKLKIMINTLTIINNCKSNVVNQFVGGGNSNLITNDSATQLENKDINYMEYIKSKEICESVVNNHPDKNTKFSNYTIDNNSVFIIENNNNKYIYYENDNIKYIMKIGSEIYKIIYDVLHNICDDSDSLFFLNLFFKQKLIFVDNHDSQHAYYLIDDFNNTISNISCNKHDNINAQIDDQFHNDDLQNINDIILSIAHSDNDIIANLNKHNINKKINNIISKIDFNDINSFYKNIKNNIIKSDIPIKFAFSFLLHLLQLDDISSDNYKLFISTLYKDINNEIVTTTNDGNIELIKKYINEKYLNIIHS